MDTSASNYDASANMDDGSCEYLSIDEDGLPNDFALHQNYPNPFNPTTTLQYDLPEDSQVNIMIYDLMGRTVKTLVNNQQSAGFKSVVWDATNDLGQPVSAGMYLYRIKAGNFHQVKKMILLK
ncbi:MAG: T9SS type A sorting domain-containing protein [Candidatus Marinimicrobia bacterium]|nr:T9SS type A sorting domain-containing protein [Candidatus Neomarinimicrobiota bacterium]